jgi:hypothetical protein
MPIASITSAAAIRSAPDLVNRVPIEPRPDSPTMRCKKNPPDWASTPASRMAPAIHCVLTAKSVLLPRYTKYEREHQEHAGVRVPGAEEAGLEVPVSVVAGGACQRTPFSASDSHSGSSPIVPTYASAGNAIRSHPGDTEVPRGRARRRPSVDIRGARSVSQTPAANRFRARTRTTVKPISQGDARCKSLSRRVARRHHRSRVQRS